MNRKLTIPPELEGEYTVRVIDMPDCSPGFILYDDDDHANIYLNARYNRESNANTADHELAHILNDDFHNTDDIRTVETRADGHFVPSKPIPNLIRARDLIPKSLPPLGKVDLTKNACIVSSKTDEVHRFPRPLSPHQAAVLFRAITDLDAILFSDRYDY